MRERERKGEEGKGQRKRIKRERVKTGLKRVKKKEKIEPLSSKARFHFKKSNNLSSPQKN